MCGFSIILNLQGIMTFQRQRVHSFCWIKIKTWLKRSGNDRNRSKAPARASMTHISCTLHQQPLKDLKLNRKVNRNYSGLAVNLFFPYFVGFLSSSSFIYFNFFVSLSKTFNKYEVFLIQEINLKDEQRSSMRISSRKIIYSRNYFHNSN